MCVCVCVCVCVYLVIVMTNKTMMTMTTMTMKTKHKHRCRFCACVSSNRYVQAVFTGPDTRLDEHVSLLYHRCLRRHGGSVELEKRYKYICIVIVVSYSFMRIPGPVRIACPYQSEDMHARTRFSLSLSQSPGLSLPIYLYNVTWFQYRVMRNAVVKITQYPNRSYKVTLRLLFYYPEEKPSWKYITKNLGVCCGVMVNKLDE